MSPRSPHDADRSASEHDHPTTSGSADASSTEEARPLASDEGFDNAMSLATLDAPRTSAPARRSSARPVRPVTPLRDLVENHTVETARRASEQRAATVTPVRPVAPAPRPTASPAPVTATAPAAPSAIPTPEGTEARGFALYVGLDAAKAAAAGIDLPALVEELRRVTREFAPGAETFATVAIAPAGAGGRDVDVVRRALKDPAALAQQKREEQAARGGSAEAAPVERGTGVVIDISRKRVVLDGEVVGLTYKEFELLQFLVLREGLTIERAAIIEALWSDAAPEDVPSERTIDVHVRRLRSKLGSFEDIVRTVRGAGYRFDRHADVSIRWASAPSPDVF